MLWLCFLDVVCTKGERLPYLTSSNIDDKILQQCSSPSLIYVENLENLHFKFLDAWQIMWSRL